MKNLTTFENYCKIDKQDKKFLGYNYTKNKKIDHKWYLVKIGKDMYTDSDGTVFKVKFRCSTCGEEVVREFASWGNLLKIGVPNEILQEYKNKGWYYSLTLSHRYASDLNPPIPTTFDKNISLYY